MNTTTTAVDAIESARQEYAEENAAEGEPCDQAIPGSYACHALLDRTAMLMTTLERYILEHPACLNNKEWFAMAYKAVDLLNELYQKIGGEHLEKTADS